MDPNCPLLGLGVPHRRSFSNSQMVGRDSCSGNRKLSGDHQTGNVPEPGNNSNNSLSVSQSASTHTILLNSTTTLSGHITHLFQVRSQAPAAKCSSAARPERQQASSWLEPRVSHLQPLHPTASPLMSIAASYIIHLSLSSSGCELLYGALGSYSSLYSQNLVYVGISTCY